MQLFFNQSGCLIGVPHTGNSGPVPRGHARGNFA